MNTEKLEIKIEKLVEKIKSINYSFRDGELEREGEDLIEAAVTSLEGYLDLANTDYENQESKNNDSIIDEE